MTVKIPNSNCNKNKTRSESSISLNTCRLISRVKVLLLVRLLRKLLICMYVCIVSGALMRQSCHRLLEHQHPGEEEPPLYSPIDQISGTFLYVFRCKIKKCQSLERARMQNKFIKKNIKKKLVSRLVDFFYDKETSVLLY